MEIEQAQSVEEMIKRLARLAMSLFCLEFCIATPLLIFQPSYYKLIVCCVAFMSAILIQILSTRHSSLTSQLEARRPFTDQEKKAAWFRYISSFAIPAIASQFLAWTFAFGYLTKLGS